MITITITNKPTGRKGLLYEFRGRKGRKKYVPSYLAFAECFETAQSFEFTVTRDSSSTLFGESLENRYDKNGECPPNIMNMPYCARVINSGPIGFRLELFERKYAKTKGLIGKGPIVRTNIQIHVGARASHGCILVAGGSTSYYRSFEKPLRAMLKQTDQINVVVESRF